MWLCDVLLKHADKGAINFADFKQHLPSANFPPMVDTLYWTHIFEDTKYPTKIYVMALIKFKGEWEKNLMFDDNTTKEEINNNNRIVEDSNGTICWVMNVMQAMVSTTGYLEEKATATMVIYLHGKSTMYK